MMRISEREKEFFSYLFTLQLKVEFEVSRIGKFFLHHKIILKSLKLSFVKWMEEKGKEDLKSRKYEIKEKEIKEKERKKEIETERERERERQKKRKKERKK